jgi:hypothetical protein
LSTIRDQILDAIGTALNTGRPSGIPAAERSPVDPYEGGLGEVAIAYRPFTESCARAGGRSGPLTHRKLVVRFAVRASGNGSEEAEQLADPVLEYLTAKLGGTNLGGLAHQVDEAVIRWDLAVRDTSYILVPVLCAISYQTKVADATQRA